MIGVEMTRIDEQTLAEIEPNAKTVQYALHVPSTAVVDPSEICHHLKQSLQANGIRFFLVI